MVAHIKVRRGLRGAGVVGVEEWTSRQGRHRSKGIDAYGIAGAPRPRSSGAGDVDEVDGASGHNGAASGGRCPRDRNGHSGGGGTGTKSSGKASESVDARVWGPFLWHEGDDRWPARVCRRQWRQWMSATPTWGPVEEEEVEEGWFFS